MGTNFALPNGPLRWISGPKDFSGDNNLGLYATEATQRYAYGARFLDWDGSVYRYCKAGAAITNVQLAVHVTATGAATSIEAISAAAAIGDKTLYINQASITVDQYSGGYVVIFPAGGSAMIRSVVANTASDSGGSVKLSLNHPLSTVLTASDTYELYASPYASVSHANTDGTLSFLGTANVAASSSGFLWTKTWGPIFIAPQSGIGGAYVRTGFFRHDGSIDVHPAVATKANVSDQIAGFTLIGSAAGDGPLFMLQVSI